jgi:hypothetical protein
VLTGTALDTADAVETVGPAGGLPSDDPTGFEAMVASGDGHFARRHEGHRGGTADPREIADAVAAYAAAAAREPGDPAVHWKLARAVYFQGTYTGLDEKAQRAVFARGRAAGEEALAILARRRSPRSDSDPDKPAPAALAARLRGEPDAAPALFWTAVDWGQWGLAVSKADAATQGVARRVRDYCLALIELDPSFEEGGGYRILGRLHDRAPRIPLVTGWVSRAEALRYLRLAVAVAPENLVNLQFLAEALDRAGDRGEARALEERVVAASPGGSHLVEELAIQEAARANLARWKAGNGG